MKTPKNLITIAACALLLAGCAPQETQQTNQNQQSQTTQQQTTTPLNTEDIETFGEALRQRNASLCDSIENQKIKTDCQDQIISEQALNNNDSTACADLSTEDQQTECLLAVEAQKVQEEESQAEQEQLTNDSSQLQAIVDSGNISQCNTIEDENWREDCVYNIIVQQVLENGNVSLCNQLESDQRQEECIQTHESTLGQESQT